MGVTDSVNSVVVIGRMADGEMIDCDGVMEMEVGVSTSVDSGKISMVLSPDPKSKKSVDDTSSDMEMKGVLLLTTPVAKVAGEL